MNRLDKLRKEIDRIDRSIEELVCKRVEIAREIGKVKKELGVQVEDAEREKEILGSVGELRGIFKQIIEYCKNEERR